MGLIVMLFGEAGTVEADAATLTYPLEKMQGARGEFDASDLGEDGFPKRDDLKRKRLAHYRLGSVLGRGSMARVYAAEHLGLGRKCAIKVLNPGLVALQPLVRERFWAEARVVANLVHPHVVTIHNVGSDRGYHFIEMEHVAGGLRDQGRRRLGSTDSGLAGKRTGECVPQLVSAISPFSKSGLTPDLVLHS